MCCALPSIMLQDVQPGVAAVHLLRMLHAVLRCSAAGSVATRPGAQDTARPLGTLLVCVSRLSQAERDHCAWPLGTLLVCVSRLFRAECDHCAASLAGFIAWAGSLLHSCWLAFVGWLVLHVARHTICVCGGVMQLIPLWLVAHLLLWCIKAVGTAFRCTKHLLSTFLLNCISPTFQKVQRVTIQVLGCCPHFGGLQWWHS